MKWQWVMVWSTALATPAWALQLEMSRPELCQLSSHVVLAEVTGVETRWTPSGSIEREAHVAVIHSVVGDGGDDLDLHLPGGTIGEMTVRVEDVPPLLENARYLLFVAPDLEGRLVVIGGDQGAIRITPEGARKGETEAKALASVEVCRAQ